MNKSHLIVGVLILKKLVALGVLAYAASAADAAPLTLPPPPPPPVPAPATGFQTFGNGLPLPEFLRITLGELARRPYILAPEVASSGLTVAADLSKAKPRDPLPLIRAVLDSLGLEARDLEGVLLIEKKRTQAKPVPEQLVYRPRHRPVSSLSSYFNMYPELSFAYGNGVAIRTPTPGSSDSTGAGETLQPSMTGATTFSSQDKDPSYLVVSGPLGDVKRFKVFLDQVDVPIPEVMLQAHVFEVRNTDGRDGGVRMVLDLLNGRVGATLGGATAATSDVFRLNLPNLSLAVSALTSDSRVKLVSSPVLRAADGTTASANIGTSVPTLGSIVSQQGSTQQSVTYQDSGVLLSVSPRVLEESIRLVISQELSSFVRTETGLSNTPTKLRRAFKSDVVARSGESLLLGGLSEVQDSTSKQTTFFGFGNSSASKSSSEIVVLLTATRLDPAAQAVGEKHGEERTDTHASPAPQP